MKLICETTIETTITDVWKVWTTPEIIKEWYAIPNQWHTTNVNFDLKRGATFLFEIKLKNSDETFNYTGTIINIKPFEFIEYILEDRRVGLVEFIPSSAGVTIRLTIDSNTSLSKDSQQKGWQGILDSFSNYVKSYK